MSNSLIFKVTTLTLTSQIMIENNQNDQMAIRDLIGTDDCVRFIHGYNDRMDMYEVHTKQKPSGQWWVDIHPVDTPLFVTNFSRKEKVKLTVVKF